MENLKKILCGVLSFILVFATSVTFGVSEASAASYPKISAFQITRVYQPDYDTNGICYWSSMATVQGYCLGTYTYGGITTNYRVAGKDYDYLKRSDAITKFFKDGANGYANDKNNLTNFYPIKMTRVLDGIGKNTYTYELIYKQLAQGKPVIVYTGTHASVVIGYNGSSSTLQPSGFTVMEIKKDGSWWSNSATYYNSYANSPQVDSASGSFMSCYVTLDSWITYCGGKLQEICYPTDAVKTASEFSFSANGGTGNMTALSVESGGKINIPQCSFTYEGYTFKGYNVQRKSDGKYYGTGGWQSLQATIDNNYTKKLYIPGESYDFGSEWTRDGGVVGGDYVFIAQWEPTEITYEFYGNYSGTNYMMSIDKSTFENYYQSRNTSVYTVAVENVLGEDVLEITGTSAGAVGKDLLFVTQTNKGINYNYNTGDSKAMTLTFKAKSSVDGAKMYFRWGYTSDTTAVTLSDQWAEYTIDMTKQINDGAHLHPYFDKEGVFYIADIALVDEGAPLAEESETCDVVETKVYPLNTCFGILPEVSREGYTFLGWYTSKWGGERITQSSEVADSHTALYARWEKAESPTELPNPTETVTQPVTETAPTTVEAQPTSTTTDVEFVLMGDSDMSGKVNVKDATRIQKMLAKMVELDAKEVFAANVVDDGKVNIKDATAIQKYCAFMDVDAEIGVEVIYIP